MNENSLDGFALGILTSVLSVTAFIVVIATSSSVAPAAYTQTLECKGEGFNFSIPNIAVQKYEDGNIVVVGNKGTLYLALDGTYICSLTKEIKPEEAQ